MWRVFDPSAVTLPINQWILSELLVVRDALVAYMAEYRFDLAAMGIRGFILGKFCDWYVEIVKPILLGSNEGEKSETRACFAYILRQAMMALHPFMPFVSEEIWQSHKFFGDQSEFLAASRLESLNIPKFTGVAEIDKVIDVIERVRELRGVQNVAATAEIIVALDSGRLSVSALQQFSDRYQQAMFNLTKSRLKIGFADRSVVRENYVAGEYEIDFMIDWNGHVDAATQKANFSKELAVLQAELIKVEKKLGNAEFIAKADPEVVTENQLRLTNFREKIGFYQKQITQLGGKKLP